MTVEVKAILRRPEGSLLTPSLMCKRKEWELGLEEEPGPLNTLFTTARKRQWMEEKQEVE